MPKGPWCRLLDSTDGHVCYDVGIEHAVSKTIASQPLARSTTKVYSRGACKSRVRLLVQLLLWLAFVLLVVAAVLLELLGTWSLLQPHLLAVGQLDAAVLNKALPVSCSG